MPHQRTRHLKKLFSELLGFSPLVGLFGHRQVGKTTFVNSIAKEYTTLDLASEVSLIQSNPMGYLRDRKSPFAIDEAQLEPTLFPALKESVRRSSKPGQFIITGSVRFSSRKQIRESLTGRIVSWELLPMDLGETHELGLGNSIQRIAQARKFELELRPRKKFTEKDYDEYISKGGLPGLFSIRNETVRRQKLELQIETLLERDLRLIVQSKVNYTQLRRLISELAFVQLEPFEIYPLARKTQISVPTLMGLMRAFEAIYLIRWVPSLGNSKKASLVFEDQGEATYLVANQKARDPVLDLSRFLYANLRTQWHYQNKFKVSVLQWRTRTGQWIPWVIRGYGPTDVALIPVIDDLPSPAVMSTAASFLKKHPNARVVLVHLNKTDRLHHPQIRSLHWSQLV